MQNTSSTYKSIIAGDHSFETKITVAGNEIVGSDIVSLKIERIGLSENRPSVGAALSATLDLTIMNPSFTIPRMAEIVVYMKAVNRTTSSEWLPCGTFYIDTRAITQGDIKTLRITAYDAMMKGEQDYPDTNHTWPYKDTSVVAEIASTLGVAVDSRTNTFLTTGYMINLPAEYTMREVLEHIAGMYGGNFVITAENKLLFVPLYGLDPEEIIAGADLEYLADESGNAIQFGSEGWYALV